MDGSQVRVDEVVGRVRVPAILLMVHGVLAGIASVGQVLLTLATWLGYTFIDLDSLLPPDAPREQLEDLALLLDTMTAFGVLSNLMWSAFQLAVAAFIVWGGQRLMEVQDRSIVILAALCAVVPGISSCCSAPIGLVAGVWALVIVFDEQVADVFEHHDHPEHFGPPG